jgi:hypothetical protein
MSIVVPKYRVFDDSNSVLPNLALTLMKVPEAAYSVFWDLIPFYKEPIRQLNFDVASRSITSRQVVLGANILTSDTQITLDSATRARVTPGHVLYHPATKQRFILDTANTTSGVCNIRDVLQAYGGSRTQVNSGQTLLILAQSEHYDQINAVSRFEDTSVTSNYIQDVTEMLEFSTADMREMRKWGVDKQLRLKERMRDIVKDLNRALIYNAPLQASAGHSATTAGFDYVVDKAGNKVAANSSGTADLADIRGVLKTLYKNGVGPGDGLVIHMSANVYFAYETVGLADINLQGQPGAEFVVGGAVKGLHFAGLGFVPFYADPLCDDDVVRFVCTSQAAKAYYQGLEAGAPLESPRVIDESSLSTSKIEKSTFQQKWGTVFQNPDRCHYLLTGTGLNS